MKTTSHLSRLFLPILLFGGFVHAQRPQGAGLETRAVAHAAGVPIGINADGDLVRSTDGGTTYIDVIYHPPNPNDTLTALSTQGSFVVAGGNGFLMTLDLAVLPLSPQLPVVPSLFGEFRGIAHNGAGEWLAVTDAAEVLSSTDGGATWGGWGTGISAFALSGVAWNVGNNRWIVVGDDTVYSRASADTTWTAQTLAGASLQAVSADASGNVLVTGEAGALYLSNDNGANFTQILVGDYSQDLASIAVLGVNSFAVGGHERILLDVTDGMGTLLLEPDGGTNEVVSVSFSDGAVLMAGVDIVQPPFITAVDDPLNPVPVTLTPDDPSDDLFYTKDGSTPDAQSSAYTAPFLVVGSTTVRAIARSNGIFSAVVSTQVEAGLPTPFAISSIVLSGANFIMTQDASDNGLSYTLQFTDNLISDPLVWTDDTSAVLNPQTGTGAPLTWTLPVPPPSVRFWRIILTP